jgi:hypothetical protein
MSNHDNLDRKNRRKAAREANKLSKTKRKKAKNTRKRAKKVAKRKAAGLCEHCGRKPEECTKLVPAPATAA